MKFPSLDKVRHSSIDSKPKGKDWQRAEDVLQVLPNLVCSSLHENGRMVPAAQCSDCDVRENTLSKRGGNSFNSFQTANVLPTIPGSKSFDKFPKSKQKHSQSSLSSLYQQSLQSKNSMAFWRRIELHETRSKPHKHEDNVKRAMSPYVDPLSRPNRNFHSKN